jgi:hypothetical protein
MISLLRHLIGWMVGVLRSREDLILENLALRQQLLALHAKRPRRHLSTCINCSGLLCEGSGLDGKSRWFWSLQERSWLGIGVASGCTGNGSREPAELEAENA